MTTAESSALSGVVKNVAVSDGSDGDVLLFDRRLYQRAHDQWLLGDWESLAKLDRKTVEPHPERARLALLAAVAQQRVGTPERARLWASLAREWGCDRELMSRVLLADAYDTLSLASAAKGDDKRAERFIEQSAALMLPDTSRTFLLPIKHRQQDERLERARRLYRMRVAADRAVCANESLALASKTQGYLDHPRFSASAYRYYQTLDESTDPKPFLLLDAKSLPRSGLHYLKNTLSRLLQQHFSFCEWYQEPGCCKKQPCATTAFSEAAAHNHVLRIRLIKSHDFNLDDPIFPALSHLHRVILVRDPLFVLTSYFALDELSRYRGFLSDHGVNLEKIWLSHEPEMVAQAYRLVDQCYEPLDMPKLEQWLTEKTGYIHGFLDKWVYSAIHRSDPFTHILRYEDIDAYIVGLLSSLTPWADEPTRARLEAFSAASRPEFKPRSDPFTVNSVRVSEYLVERADLFRAMADSIRLPERLDGGH